jgi:hypothetical protein
LQASTAFRRREYCKTRLRRARIVHSPYALAFRPRDFYTCRLRRSRGLAYIQDARSDRREECGTSVYERAWRALALPCGASRFDCMMSFGLVFARGIVALVYQRDPFLFFSFYRKMYRKNRKMTFLFFD